MNDQQHSSADALTDAQRRTLQYALDLFVAMGHSPDSDHVRTLSAMLAAYRVQQPAAAPIDTPTDREFALSAAICVHPKGVYGDEGGSMCCPITHTRDASFAPSPADERDKR